MARTKEQLEAGKQLQSIASAFRVHLDAEGWPVIRGQRGRIEYHDGKAVAVYTDRPKMFRKLFAIPGVRRHQRGDLEMRALFSPSALSQVARAIRARRRYRPSAAQLRNLAAGTGRGLTKRPQNEPAPVGDGVGLCQSDP